jgi:simple sugar transport system substrate-binding protein
MSIRKKSLGFTAVAVAAALALTACSSGGGTQATQQSGSQAAGGGGAVADTPQMTIAMITHEAPGDTFWDKVRSGAQAAAAKDNVDLKYSSDPDASKQATLIQNAIDSKVDGIATAMANPDALAPAVKAATDAGIPVVGFNSGIDQAFDLGAIMYFGSDEQLAGETVGQRIAEEGGKHPLCVIMEAGQIALETRCAGVKSAVPGTENIQVQGTDMPSVQSTVDAKLRQDPSIDWVVTLGAPFAMGVLPALKDSGSSAKLATFDLNADAAKAIQAGDIQFSVDQQPYLQGYEAVDSLWLNLTNGNVLGGGLPVLTGPSIVDSENIDAILTYAEAGTR